MRCESRAMSGQWQIVFGSSPYSLHRVCTKARASTWLTKSSFSHCHGAFDAWLSCVHTFRHTYTHAYIRTYIHTRTALLLSCSCVWLTKPLFSYSCACCSMQGKSHLLLGSSRCSLPLALMALSLSCSRAWLTDGVVVVVFVRMVNKSPLARHTRRIVSVPRRAFQLG